MSEGEERPKRDGHLHDGPVEEDVGHLDAVLLHYGALRFHEFLRSHGVLFGCCSFHLGAKLGELGLDCGETGGCAEDFDLSREEGETVESDCEDDGVEPG